MTKKPEPRIAAAVGTAAAGGGRPGLGAAIEAAMVKAHEDCFAKGITDDDSIKEAKLAAREKVRAEFAKREAAEAKAAKAAAEKRR